MRFILMMLGVLVAAGMLYVRLAPDDPARWNVAVPGVQDADFPTGALRVLAVDEEGFARADAWMREQPRTRVLAGSVAEGRVTYITRTRVFGFPDYTTLDFDRGKLKAFARLRYGLSDLGVNRTRLEGLVAALQR